MRGRPFPIQTTWYSRRNGSREDTADAGERPGWAKFVSLPGNPTGDQCLGYETQPFELEGAFSDRTVGVLYVIAGFLPPGVLSLQQTIQIAHARGIPVVVDAAAQLPPPENLWRFTRDLGADVAVFSGGKDLHGPQASGLIVGKQSIIDAVRMNGYPNHSVGRPMKIGKENIVGALAAVEWYLSQDHDARLKDCERQVQHLAEVLAGCPGVVVRRAWPGEAGEPLPRALVELTAGESRLGRDALIAELRSGDPIIEVGRAPNGIYVNPATLGTGEMEYVARTLNTLLHASL